MIEFLIDGRKLVALFSFVSLPLRLTVHAQHTTYRLFRDIRPLKSQGHDLMLEQSSGWSSVHHPLGIFDQIVKEDTIRPSDPQLVSIWWRGHS